MPQVKVQGYIRELSDGRSVWVGKLNDAWHVRLESPDKTLQFGMTVEVADALVDLIANHPEGVKRVRRR